MTAATENIKYKKRKMRVDKLWPYIFVLPFILLYALFNLYPIIYSFFISLTNWDGISEKTFIGFKNYFSIFTSDPYFFKSIWNTVLIMLQSTPFVIIFGLILAAFMFNLSVGRQAFQTITFLPYITTPVAIGFIFAFLFDWQTGIINNILIHTGLLKEGVNWLGDARYARLVVAIMIIWKYTGYHMVVYLSGLSSISPELYEAAKVDGSSQLNTFFRITVPLLQPITVFLVITDIIGGLQMFDEPSLMFSGWIGGGAAGGPERSCLTAIWNFYDVTFKSTSRFGYGAAIAYSLFMIIIIFSFAGFKLTNRREKSC